MWFKKLWLSEKLLKKIKQKGYQDPTPIQEWVIPLLLNSQKDIIWQAQTWTGKTASFALPILENLDKRKKKVQAIILTPTRELAIQVASEIKSFADDIKILDRFGNTIGGNRLNIKGISGSNVELATEDAAKRIAKKIQKKGIG